MNFGDRSGTIILEALLKTGGKYTYDTLRSRCRDVRDGSFSGTFSRLKRTTPPIIMLTDTTKNGTALYVTNGDWLTGVLTPDKNGEPNANHDVQLEYALNLMTCEVSRQREIRDTRRKSSFERVEPILRNHAHGVLLARFIAHIDGSKKCRTSAAGIGREVGGTVAFGNLVGETLMTLGYTRALESGALVKGKNWHVEDAARSLVRLSVGETLMSGVDATAARLAQSDNARRQQFLARPDKAAELKQRGLELAKLGLVNPELVNPVTPLINEEDHSDVQSHITEAEGENAILHQIRNEQDQNALLLKLKKIKAANADLRREMGI